MVDLGIEDRFGLVYEGSGRYGHAVWPTPLLTPAKIVFESEDKLIAETRSDPISEHCRFREDYFDPISRIRRGRFYTASGQQPTNWYLQPHPALPFEATVNDVHNIEKPLSNFSSLPVWQMFKEKQGEQPIVLLGQDQRFTIWTIVGIEAISTGEDLVTLRGRTSFGVLPKLNLARIPEEHRADLTGYLDKFLDEVHQSAPISVIDRARDAASHILIIYAEEKGKPASDLRSLSKYLEKDCNKYIASWAANIIAHLHARAKPSERARRDLLPIREQDAQFATHCLGTILCELGWAEWN